MVHIVFQQADVEVLRKSFELDPTMEGEIIEIKDDYAVGPIRDIYLEEGIAARRKWWIDILTGTHYEGIVEKNNVDDNATVRNLLHKLDEDPDEEVWIWAAQNKHDVCGYYWLMSQLNAYQGRLQILYLNNLPFINEKGHIFYPANLFEIQPKEFLKARKLARPITLSEFEIDPDEWKKLCEEDTGVRLLEGGKKLESKHYDFYDPEILQFISFDWLKGNKLLHNLLSKARDTTGDAYLLWRIRLLIESGELDMQGNFRNMKEFEIKRKETGVSV
ncbi:MAG: DUF1835 domain-containing protein [Chitinophagaceae bacterium]